MRQPRLLLCLVILLGNVSVSYQHLADRPSDLHSLLDRIQPDLLSSAVAGDIKRPSASKQQPQRRLLEPSSQHSAVRRLLDNGSSGSSDENDKDDKDKKNSPSTSPSPSPTATATATTSVSGSASASASATASAGPGSSPVASSSAMPPRPAPQATPNSPPSPGGNTVGTLSQSNPQTSTPVPSPSPTTTPASMDSSSSINAVSALQLMAFQNAFGKSLPGWGTFTDPCSGWAGVTCTNGTVTGLSLRNASLAGSLPKNFNMPQLMVLDLSGNQLTGTIPSDWAKDLPSLVNISISNNSLSGNIPPSVWNLKLVVLDLSFNKLTGNLPRTIPPTLVSLQLNNNSLSGSLPSEWATAKVVAQNLSAVNLTGNGFSPGLPPSWVAATAPPGLRKLDPSTLAPYVAAAQAPAPASVPGSIPVPAAPSAAAPTGPTRPPETVSIPSAPSPQARPPATSPTAPQPATPPQPPAAPEKTLPASEPPTPPITVPTIVPAPAQQPPAQSPSDAPTVTPSPSPLIADPPSRFAAPVPAAPAPGMPSLVRITASLVLVGDYLTVPLASRDADAVRAAGAAAVAAFPAVDAALGRVQAFVPGPAAAPAISMAPALARTGSPAATAVGRKLLQQSGQRATQVELLLTAPVDQAAAAVQALQQFIQTGQFLAVIQQYGTNVISVYLGQPPASAPATAPNPAPLPAVGIPPPVPIPNSAESSSGSGSSPFIPIVAALAGAAVAAVCVGLVYFLFVRPRKYARRARAKEMLETGQQAPAVATISGKGTASSFLNSQHAGHTPPHGGASTPAQPQQLGNAIYRRERLDRFRGLLGVHTGRSNSLSQLPLTRHPAESVTLGEALTAALEPNPESNSSADSATALIAEREARDEPAPLTRLTHAQQPAFLASPASSQESDAAGPKASSPFARRVVGPTSRNHHSSLSSVMTSHDAALSPAGLADDRAFAVTAPAHLAAPQPWPLASATGPRASSRHESWRESEAFPMMSTASGLDELAIIQHGFSSHSSHPSPVPPAQPVLIDMGRRHKEPGDFAPDSYKCEDPPPEPLVTVTNWSGHESARARAAAAVQPRRSRPAAAKNGGHAGTHWRLSSRSSVGQALHDVSNGSFLAYGDAQQQQRESCGCPPRLAAHDNAKP